MTPQRKQVLINIALLIMPCLLAAVAFWMTTTRHPSPRAQPAKVSKAQSQSSVVESSPKKPAPPTPKPFTFPDGSRTLSPTYRLVALYGTPGASKLGALGQQSLPDTLTRVKSLAASYQAFSSAPVMPALEIITTVASASPTANNDYSSEIPADTIQPWIDAARQAGVYVVLDLQPGRSDFLTQAKEYEGLLSDPDVGLALDPEWRLQPDQVPLKQIGSVSITEVNATADWLATLTTSKDLPQKLFVLHEFRLSMLPNRDQLDTSHTQLSTVIQMDGQGAQTTKLHTWNAILASSPNGVRFGWKNFYQKDPVVLTPQQTMALSPQPWYISYE